MGALVVKKETSSEVVDWVKTIRQKFGPRGRPDIHYAHLKPWQRQFVCASIAEKHARCFVVVSNKKNMSGYKNPRAEVARGGSANEIFYNFCARVLLERVTDFVHAHSLSEYGKVKHLEVIFSERGGVRYSQTKAYMDLLVQQARSGTSVLKARQIAWPVIHPQLIRAEPHWKIAGLQLADCIASAFCYAADAANPRPHDTLPAESLMPRMWKKNGFHARNGVTLLPWNAEDARLSEAQKKIFKHYGYDI